jgi:pentatricopeptide repeat protein
VDRYPNISDHGIIGDLQTAALVTTEGTVDFFCCPRFDSPSVFASLLDAERGGQFSVKPATDGYITRQLYLPYTAILITRFMTPEGVGEVLDFMPVIEGGPTDRHRLVRDLRVARGTMQFEMEIQPRFDYGRVGHTVEMNEAGAVFRAHNGMRLAVHIASGHPAGEATAILEPAGDGLRATFTMREGDARDPIWRSTLRAIDSQLVSDSLVYRYNPADSPDGLHGDEGTFSLCTFLYVDALARAGRLDDAVLTFEKMQTYGNHVGLFSEEIGPTGEQLGNFPQAFTHLSLINAAVTLNRELDRREANPAAALARVAGI